MELKYSSMEINIEENIAEVNSMEKENILGSTLPFLKEISTKV